MSSIPTLEAQNPTPKAPDYREVLFHSVSSFLGQSLMQVVDLIFCRDLGSAASATVGTSTAFFAWFMILGIGITSSIEFLLPHALGSNRKRRADEYFFSGTFLILILSGASMALLSVLTSYSTAYGMNPTLITPVSQFSHILSFSFLPTFLIPLIRVELQARGFSNDTTYAFLGGNLLNIFLNWALVLGHAGFEPLGVMGSAWSNVLSRYAILAFLLYRLKRARRSDPYQIPILETRFKLRMKTILRLGTPISLHMLFEIGAFIFVGTLASRLSADETAAHSIAISLASFVFMIPAGMASAAALTMSRAMGEKKPAKAALLGNRTLKLGLIYAITGSAVIFALRGFIINIYTRDPDAARIGQTLLIITAVFQLGDALQTILSGCIRGLGETKVQAKMNAIGHWCVGIPLGLFFCFTLHLGVIGLWIGLSAGLFSVALLLGYRYREMTK